MAANLYVEFCEVSFRQLKLEPITLKTLSIVNEK